MNKLFLTVSFCMMMAISAMAQDKLFIDNFTVDKGGMVEVKVNLTNAVNVYAAIQFDLSLPEGLIIATNLNGVGEEVMSVTLNNSGATARLTDQTASYRKLDSGVYRFIVYSNTNARILKTEGEILTVTLKASNDFSGGNGSVGAVVLVKPDGEKVTPETTAFSVSNVSSIKGDINGDGVVNGMDIQEVINACVDDLTDDKYDVNADGQVNGMDIQEVINIAAEAARRLGLLKE